MALLVPAMAMLVPLPGAAQWLELGVPERPAADSASVEAGRALYQDRCWFCHGEEGDGGGPVAAYLWPRPRDFTTGSFKLRTTESGELPTDEDLFRTITLGMPGTAMPEWGTVLAAAERWQVISYIKSFAADLFEDEAFDPYDMVIDLGAPPREPIESLMVAGRQVYDDAKCWECHGALGRGDGERAGEIDDDWGFPTWPRDLHLGWKFTGGRSTREIYLRLRSGLDGTPMPSYAETLNEDELWQLAAYVASLTNRSQGEPSPGVVITARRIEANVPTGPDDPEWETTAAFHVPLTGQATYAPRWQTQAVTDLSVRAIYNTEEIALLLAWNDRFADTTSVDSADATAAGWEADDTYSMLYPDGQRMRGTFPDAAEIMFPVRYSDNPVLPHFVYGNAGQPVDLWRWRADLRHAPSSTSAVELRASGGGRPPETHAPESQRAKGRGVWRDGRWTVVVRRPLVTEDGAREVQLQPGRMVPIAFHVWEGANGETGLKMALSSWYFVHLRQPAAATSYLIVLVVVVGALDEGPGRARDTCHIRSVLQSRGELVSFRMYAEVEGGDRSRLLAQVVAQRERVDRRLACVRHVVAVMSGKGGVGKSHVAAMLATGLASRLERGVGVLDADLRSPTVAKLLGASGPLCVTEDGIEPAVGHGGVRVVSTDSLLEESQPLRWREPDAERFLWRGALEAGTLREFLSDVVWGPLNLLLVDLPPGADAGVDLKQLVPDLSGALVVTIPSKESHRSVARTMRSASEAGVSLLGIVENMSGYQCDECGGVRPLFRGTAGEDLSAEFDVPLLARVPFTPDAGPAHRHAPDLLEAFLGALP
jgi:DMSO reductase family type II enzyme heme b subunit